VSLAIFDLDNTLLAGDSDYLWGQFLADTGAVDRDQYEQENQRFFDDYKTGNLDIFAFLNFSLRPLSEHPMEILHAWRERFMREVISDLITPAAVELVARHRDQGDTLLIITATNSFVTRPIAERFGIDHLLATEPEIFDNHYTGRVAGTPCFQAGKVTRLNTWLESRHESMDGSWFYSDSHNDLPLLELVTHAVAVDPDEKLTTTANARGWPILRLHGAH
jgi:HAD superfamily hydrolase (TIGR01490 family)